MAITIKSVYGASFSGIGRGLGVPKLRRILKLRREASTKTASLINTTAAPLLGIHLFAPGHLLRLNRSPLFDPRPTQTHPRACAPPHTLRATQTRTGCCWLQVAHNLGFPWQLLNVGEGGLCVHIFCLRLTKSTTVPRAHTPTRSLRALQTKRSARKHQSSSTSCAPPTPTVNQRQQGQSKHARKPSLSTSAYLPLT